MTIAAADDHELAWPASAFVAMRRLGLTERHRTVLGSLTVVLGILLGNFLYVFGIATPDPIYQLSGLGKVTVPGWLNGISTIDPNIGFTTQALGKYAATQLLHGHIPWWNPLEGFGQPLIGELQSAALLPLNLLQALPNGLFLFHLSMEFIAGIATLLVLRKIGLSTLAATAGGIAFGLCGTFAWFGNAVVNPVAFLPLSILGVELARTAVAKQRRGGWLLIAVSFTFAVAAGFPEVAFYDAMLVGLWAAVRAATSNPGERWAVLRRVALGIVVGIGIACPIIVAFYDLVTVGSTGLHTGQLFADVHLPPQSRPLLLMPYSYGLVWNGTSPMVPGLVAAGERIGGYLGGPLFFLAILGAFGVRLRSLRVALASWIVVAVAATWGLGRVHAVFNLIPGEHLMLLSRYIPTSYEFAAIVLAALALEDFRRRVTTKAEIVIAGALTASALLWSAQGAATLRATLHAVHAEDGLTRVGVLWPLLISFCCIGVAMLLRGRLREVVLAGLLVTDLTACFLVPTLAAPQQATMNLGSIHFLQAHLGEYRYYGIGVPQANYGAYFGLASINVNDLPIPKAFLKAVETGLDPNAFPDVFNGANRKDPHGQSALHAFEQRWHAYAASGVRYVLTSNDGNPKPPFAHLGFPMVYRDASVIISELPNPTPLYVATPGCTVQELDVNRANVVCGEPGVVTRHELSMPGWSASIDGASTDIRTVNHTFQAVSVSAGTHEIVFRFLPKHVPLALVASGVATLVFLSGMVRSFTDWNQRRQARKPVKQFDDDDDDDEYEELEPEKEDELDHA